MMIRTVVLATLLAAAALPALAQSEPKAASTDGAPMSAADKAFLSYAAEDNQAEIDLCLLAEKKALSPAVKAFARLMVDDHVQIESRLAAVAGSEKADLPNGIGKEGHETKDKLEPLTGRKFETEFMKAQIEDHANDLKKFSKEKASTQNESLRQYAAETGPILEQHLSLAKAVQASLGGE